MNAHSRIRGLTAAPRNDTDPARLVAQINDAFASFRQRNDARLEGIEAAVNQMHANVAGLRVGGAGDAEPSARGNQAVRNLGRFARTGKVEDLTAGFEVNASMSSDSGPDGGYLAPTELSTTIERVQKNDSVMRRLARVIQSSGATFKQPMSLGGVESGWVGERESRPETDGDTLAMLEYPAFEVYANPAVTQNLLNDAAFDLGAHLSTEIAEAFTAKEGAAFITGSGVNQPRGILSYTTAATADASRTFGVLQHVVTGEAADLIAEDPGDPLINLVYSLKAKYRQNATWLMNSTVAAKVRKFKADDDTYLWQPSLQAGQPDRLLGYPVEIDEDMSDVGANAYPIAFGDFRRGYLIVDRIGMTLLRDPYTNRPYVHFYATKRVGGGLLDSNAIKLLKCST